MQIPQSRTKPSKLSISAIKTKNLSISDKPLQIQNVGRQCPNSAIDQQQQHYGCYRGELIKVYVSASV